MRFKKMLCAVMMAGLLAIPLVALGGDPDMPGATEQNTNEEKCAVSGGLDFYHCTLAFFDWLIEQSLI